MILLIDNYDSFSYNLYQLIGAIEPDIRVVRNDELSVDEIAGLQPSHIVLSPGPGRPENAGVCEALLTAVSEGVVLKETPILGVCLGHQAICEVFGATITYAKETLHGKPSEIKLENRGALFEGLPEVITGARYHSLAADPSTIPRELIVTARTEDGEVMAVQHESLKVYGVQFHPESILTPLGNVILNNFLQL
ncbi:MAG: aminodeoxychorismate/anthranilate synthase component II [Clostridiales Family XIII bacterium]|jgi:anthranilate synthase component 2|nr:aminodeoxychorismate/anthranilate synthase component II [Clostridiales Family XIII bacterium]